MQLSLDVLPRQPGHCQGDAGIHLMHKGCVVGIIFFLVIICTEECVME